MADENSSPVTRAAAPRELPPHMHLKGGRYYYVKRGPKKNLVWTGLSRNLSEALAQYSLLEGGKHHEAFDKYDVPSHWLGSAAKTVFDQTAKRAREADILFMLTVDDVVAMGMATNWRCAVSGLRFTRDSVDGSNKRPFMPSIDRIKCSGGYTKDNCRLVCVAVNFAMNDWGQGVLHQIAVSYVKHHGLMKPVRTSNAARSVAGNTPEES